MDEMRSWLKYARIEPKSFGGFVEMKDELLDEAPKEKPKMVTYGDEVMILRSSTREVVEEAEEVLRKHMLRAAANIGAVECADSFYTFIKGGDMGIAGIADPLFDNPEAVFVCARMMVPMEKHNAWERAQKGETENA